MVRLYWLIIFIKFMNGKKKGKSKKKKKRKTRTVSNESDIMSIRIWNV